MSVRYFKTVNINTTRPKSSDTSILIIYTGGTIGMDYDPVSGSLIPFDFENIIDKVPELKRFDFELTVISFINLIDSSDVKAAHWISLVRIIEDFYNDYHGFVILHGTDTMAYSASAVSYMIEHLTKPVIFTGAQLPIGASRTDARENLISALEIASTKKYGAPLVQEVCIYFDNMLLRGSRTKKVQNFNFTAFESHNFPPLAVAGIHIEYNEHLLNYHQDQPPVFYKQMSNEVFILKLYPEISREYVEAILSIPSLKGVILETFGSGNAPRDRWLRNVLEKASNRGVYILNISQCTGGRVVQGKYATSLFLKEIGVVSGGDMTLEAAITKMMFLLGNYKEPDKIKKMLEQSLRGEVSES